MTDAIVLSKSITPETDLYLSLIAIIFEEPNAFFSTEKNTSYL